MTLLNPKNGNRREPENEIVQMLRPAVRDAMNLEGPECFKDQHWSYMRELICQAIREQMQKNINTEYPIHEDDGRLDATDSEIWEAVQLELLDKEVQKGEKP